MESTIKVLLPIRNIIHTITADNEKKINSHEKIAKDLNISIYFAKR